MTILIVEDEDLAVTKLQKTLKAVDENATVVGVTDSITGTLEWLEKNAAPDLILMDIELSDGQSFEIFNLTNVTAPVIFTTSYDEYALKAFKVNSVDYLLKPIQKEELRAAIEKFKRTHADKKPIDMDNLVKELTMTLQPKEYRKRFLVKHAQKLVSVEVEDIAYFYTDGRLNFFMSGTKKYIVDYTMDELEEMLDPERFFRISRSFFVSLKSIDRIDDYFGNRLILQLAPVADKEALVSREKVSDFKRWLGK